MAFIHNDNLPVASIGSSNNEMKAKTSTTNYSEERLSDELTEDEMVRIFDERSEILLKRYRYISIREMINNLDAPIKRKHLKIDYLLSHSRQYPNQESIATLVILEKKLQNMLRKSLVSDIPEKWVLVKVGFIIFFIDFIKKLDSNQIQKYIDIAHMIYIKLYFIAFDGNIRGFTDHSLNISDVEISISKLKTLLGYE